MGYLAEKGVPQAEIDAYWLHPTKRSQTSSFLDYDRRMAARKEAAR